MRSLRSALLGVLMLACCSATAFAAPPGASRNAKKSGAAPNTSTAQGSAGNAQGPTSHVDGTARGLELAGRAATAYKEGRFEEAIALYRQAHDANPDPISIHNIGRCHEGIGYRELGDVKPDAATPEKLGAVVAEFRAAVEQYEKFLAAEPEASTRGVVEQRIRALEAQLKLLEGIAAHRDDPKTPPPVEPRSTLRVAAPWIVTGVGVATLATALVFSGMASSSESTANDPATSGVATLDAADDATTFATTADVLFAVGGTLAIAGGVWAVVDLTTAPSQRAPDSGEAATTQLRVGPGGFRVARSF